MAQGLESEDENLSDKPPHSKRILLEMMQEKSAIVLHCQSEHHWNILESSS